MFMRLISNYLPLFGLKYAIVISKNMLNQKCSSTHQNVATGTSKSLKDDGNDNI